MPYDLHESCLAIYYSQPLVGYEDSGMVSWHYILQDDSHFDIQQLLAKVRELGALYYPNERAFPVAFIIERLETIAAQQGISAPAIYHLFLNLHIPYEYLFDVYHHLCLQVCSLLNRP